MRISTGFVKSYTHRPNTPQAAQRPLFKGQVTDQEILAMQGVATTLYLQLKDKPGIIIVNVWVDDQSPKGFKLQVCVKKPTDLAPMAAHVRAADPQKTAAANPNDPPTYDDYPVEVRVGNPIAIG